MSCPPVTPALIGLSRPRGAARKKCRAFTLVETALALGIVAFALVPLVGMLPIGLRISHDASDLTMSAQIAQRLAGMVHQSDYSNYSRLANGYYYFDNEGQPLKVTNSVVPAAAIYAANIFPPLADDPAMPLLNSANVAAMRIRIVNDPGHQLQGTPTDTDLPANLQSRALTIPVHLANNGS